jgi:formylglycine-generating enzyme required for sulfatase activity
MNKELTSILNDLGLSDLLSLFEAQDIDDSVLADLSDAELKDIGIDKLGTRKKLLAAFGKPGGGGAATVSVVEDSMPQAASSSAASSTAATPAEATKESPWVNTLGMPFVPIPRFETRFCIWPVRVQDYEAYCMASGAKFPEIPFPQESDHPIVGVSWNDAIEFCVWLTGKERAEGKIDDKTVYRLPTDLEWSAAVGLPHEPEATPALRHLKAPGYPWGLRWPPPRNSGNYEHRREDQLCLKQKSTSFETSVGGWQRQATMHEDRGLSIAAADNRKSAAECRSISEKFKAAFNEWRSQWTPVDDYEFTSSVEAFAQNQLGIRDLGGNVWEWCMDSNGPGDKVLRGGSYLHGPLTDCRNQDILSGYTMDMCLPVPPSELYRSAFRLSCRDGCRNEQRLHSGLPLINDILIDEAGWNVYPDSGFRVVIAR